MRSAWIGPPMRAKRAALRPEKSRCKEISIRRRYAHHKGTCVKRRDACSMRLAQRLDTCSISATALLRKHPSMPFQHWYTKYALTADLVGPELLPALDL